MKGKCTKHLFERTAEILERKAQQGQECTTTVFVFSDHQATFHPSSHLVVQQSIENFKTCGA